MSDVYKFPDCQVIRSTPKALCILIPDLDDVGKWIPRSVIHDDSEVYDDGHEGELVLPEWFVRKNPSTFGI